MHQIIRLLTLLVSVFGTIAVFADEPDTSKKSTTSTECHQQMALIHEALLAFRAEHGDTYPQRMDELRGRYLADVAVMRCPEVRRTGDFQMPTFSRINNTGSSRMAQGYDWELSGETKVTGPRGTTARSHKLRQMQTAAAQWVPCLRCEWHQPTITNEGLVGTGEQDRHWMSLSRNGRRYLSAQYWEQEARKQFPVTYLFHPLINCREVAQLLSFRPADPSVPGAVDIGPWLNGRLEDDWLNGSGLSSLPQLAHKASQGAVNIGEIAFDVRGVMQVQPKPVSPGINDSERKRLGLWLECFPDSIGPIPLPLSGVKRLHALIGCAYRAEMGTPIAQIVLGSGGSDSAESSPPLQILYGKHVMSWWSDHDRVPPGCPAPAYEEPDPWSEGPERKLRLFVATWELPLTQKPIESLTFVSLRQSSAPFVVGLSVE